MKEVKAEGRVTEADTPAGLRNQAAESLDRHREQSAIRMQTLPVENHLSLRPPIFPGRSSDRSEENTKAHQHLNAIDDLIKLNTKTQSTIHNAIYIILFVFGYKS
ncbi:MAG: hypothetical protein HC888_02460 [Candidatus Competibacteraceae bacterium]|nr:hypothetical protein [Candidatus Competibacteraceae bacterium]